jgi:hypothetical protein
MPQADRMQPWSTTEIIKVLRFIDTNFETWHQNHLKACERAITFHNISRDPKSVYNKVHNMMKTMDDKTKRKTINSRTILSLLKSIRSRKEGTTRVETTEYDDFKLSNSLRLL